MALCSHESLIPAWAVTVFLCSCYVTLHQPFTRQLVVARLLQRGMYFISYKSYMCLLLKLSAGNLWIISKTWLQFQWPLDLVIQIRVPSSVKYKGAAFTLNTLHIYLPVQFKWNRWRNTFGWKYAILPEVVDVIVCYQQESCSNTPAYFSRLTHFTQYSRHVFPFCD